MNKEILKQALETVTSSKKDRLHMAERVLDEGEVKHLMELAFEPAGTVSVKASWVLELVAGKKPEVLFPYLDLFLGNMRSVKEESAIRPVAKVCEILLKYHFSKKKGKHPIFTREQLEKCTEACFDWLLGDHKVAAKVFSMSCLYYTGLEIPWVHGELEVILQQHYKGGSAAYQARARDVLKRVLKAKHARYRGSG